MPPLPPVPPPPDVAGAMIESFGNPKPPEPPSPHGSEYSVGELIFSEIDRETCILIPSYKNNRSSWCFPLSGKFR